MKLQLKVKKPNEAQAVVVSNLLLELSGIRKDVFDILSSQCLVAIESEKIIALAEVVEKDKAEIYYFNWSLGVREKKRIKNRFFSVIFSKSTWIKGLHEEAGAIRQETIYMLPG